MSKSTAAGQEGLMLENFAKRKSKVKRIICPSYLALQSAFNSREAEQFALLTLVWDHTGSVLLSQQ